MRGAEPNVAAMEQVGPPEQLPGRVVTPHRGLVRAAGDGQRLGGHCEAQ